MSATCTRLTHYVKSNLPGIVLQDVLASACVGEVGCDSKVAIWADNWARANLREKIVKKNTSGSGLNVRKC